MEMHRCITLVVLFGFAVSVQGLGLNGKHDDVLKCVPTGEPRGDVSINQSQHDKRQYKYLTLDNKLRIVLVSDPAVERSAAAVSVHAGYTNDPPTLPGLAHFCEHMLFLGTEKYPVEGEFDNFLGKHGGRSNAYTSEELTLYYFKIKSEYLHPALDRFAQFFVAPLFDANSTDRELHAIDQEYQKNYRNDYRRMDYIEKIGSRPGHPYGKFGTGNLKTLKTIPKEKNIDILKMLLQFYDKYYSANIMTVAVVGKESLENLEDMVVPMFKKVKNRNTLLTSQRVPYGKEEMGIMLRIPTIQKMSQLQIRFQLPDLRCFQQSRPLNYFSQLIAHEGEGSLAAHLKTLGWARALIAGPESGMIGFEFFVVQVELTRKGMGRVEDIITLLFQYLKMMEDATPQKWIHDEMQVLDGTKFRFQDKQRSDRYVRKLAENMQVYEAEHVLDGGFISGEFMNDKVSELFKYFSPDSFRYLIASNTFKGPWNKYANYYDTNYSEHKIPGWKVMKWKNVTANPKFHLPLKNPFIPDPDDLKIVVPKRNKTMKDVPVIIKDNEMVRVWYKADDTFYLPKSTLTIRVHSPDAIATPANHNHLILFVDLIREAAMEFGYAAQLAGISYYIRSLNTGLMISIYGFSSKQDVLLRKLLYHVVSIKKTMKVDKFHVVKQKLLEQLKNADVQVPYRQAVALQNYVMSETYWNNEERLQYMDQLTPHSLKQYIGDFLQNIYVEGQFYGNLLRSDALATFSVAEKILVQEAGASPMLPIQHLHTRGYKLKEGTKYLFEKRSPIHSFSALRMYLEVGLQTERNDIMCELFNQMIASQIFDTLRTKEQLGYIVYSGVSRSRSVVGVRVVVQSERPPSYVNTRIEKFFEKIKKNLANMSNKKFKDFVEATAVKLLEKPKKLLLEARVYATEISQRQYHFRRAEKEVKLLRKLKKDDVVEFFKQHIDPVSQRRKMLAVVVLGKNATSLAEDDKGDWTVINDILRFKTSRPLYEHVMPYNNIPLLSRTKVKEEKEH